MGKSGKTKFDDGVELINHYSYHYFIPSFVRCGIPSFCGKGMWVSKTDTSSFFISALFSLIPYRLVLQ